MSSPSAAARDMLLAPPTPVDAPPPYDSLDHTSSRGSSSSSNSSTVSLHLDYRHIDEPESNSHDFNLPPFDTDHPHHDEQLPPYISRRTLFHPPGFVPSSSSRPSSSRPRVQTSNSSVRFPRGFTPSKSTKPLSHSNDNSLLNPRGYKPSSSSSSSASRNLPIIPSSANTDNLRNPRGFRPSTSPSQTADMQQFALDASRSDAALRNPRGFVPGLANEPRVGATVGFPPGHRGQQTHSLHHHRGFDGGFDAGAVAAASSMAASAGATGAGC